MKISLLLGTTLGLVLLAGRASAAVTNYTVSLTGDQETPAVTTNATGSGTLAFDSDTKQLSGSITLMNVTGSNAAHIHEGACGVSGGPVVTLMADDTTLDIDETLEAAQVTALVAGNLYVNVHTGTNPNGEIRGQLYAQGSGKTCPAAGADGGSTTSSSSGSTSSSSGSTSSSSGESSSSGATTTRADGGSNAAAPAAEDDGCSTTGSAPGSGLAIAFGVGVALAALSRNRRKP